MADSAKRRGVGNHPKGPPSTSSAEALRLRADEIARARLTEAPQAVDGFSPAEAQQVIHNLRVHQIELELQNEELRRTQESLEHARARYFDLYDLAPVGYLTVSEDGLILEANLTGARLLDVDRAALVKQPLSLFVLREDQDTYYLACRKLVNTGTDQAFELRMAKSDGRPFWVWVEASIAEDDDGTPVSRMVLTDITNRKTSEQALRAAEKLRESWSYYRQIAESLPQLVWTSDADGAWDYLGPQWKQYTGFPEEEQLGLGWARQLHPDDRGAVIIDWNKAVATGTMFDTEFRIRRHDGTYRRFKGRAVPMRNDAGVISKWFGTNTDIEDAPAAKTSG
jgi:PAS domain S-box-containing protein